MKSYCRGNARKAASVEERNYWNTAADDGSLFARRLVISGRNPG
jgi:hypothetical protein